MANSDNGKILIVTTDPDVKQRVSSLYSDSSITFAADRSEATALMDKDSSWDMLVLDPVKAKELASMYMEPDIDPKSGLYCKNAFIREVRKLLNSDLKERYVLLIWDIDGFKIYNDIYGVEAGDRHLARIGTYYTEHAGRIGIHGRWESDHFVSCLKLEDFNKYNVAELISGNGGVEVDGFRLTTRIGVYMINDTSMDINIMCDRAMMALKSIKDNYERRIAIYDDSMRTELLETRQMIGDMQGAINRHEFMIYFQPQYNYANHGLHGAEALIRWQHPEKGLISPAKFIPVFEKNGFITCLDKFVWEECCRLQRKWKDMEFDTVPISVNVSKLDIYVLNLSDYFAELIHKYRLSPEDIRIEITESAYIDNPSQLCESVEKLQKAGFTVEMDDFGSGSSSLNTLKDVPVDMLKLDMSFISKDRSGNGTKGRSGSILSSVIRMSNWLKLPVLAEGVETKAQADFLRSIGCVYMQGYYFAHPMPVNDFEKLLAEEKRERRDDHGTDDLPDLPGALEFKNSAAPSHHLFDSYVGGASVIEYDGHIARIVNLSEDFLKCIGREENRDDLVGADLGSVFDPESMNMFVRTFCRCIETHKEENCRLSYYIQPGKDEWIHARIRLLSICSGKELFYLAIENISRQMSLVMGSRYMADQLYAIVDKVDAGLCEYEIRSQSVHMIFCNEKLCSMFGFTEKEYMDRFEDKPYLGICPEDLYEIEQGFDKIRNREVGMFSESCRHICKDGSWKQIQINCSVARITERALFCSGIIFEK